MKMKVDRDGFIRANGRLYQVRQDNNGNEYVIEGRSKAGVNLAGFALQSRFGRVLAAIVTPRVSILERPGYMMPGSTMNGSRRQKFQAYDIHKMIRERARELDANRMLHGMGNVLLPLMKLGTAGAFTYIGADALVLVGGAPAAGVAAVAGTLAFFAKDTVNGLAAKWLNERNPLPLDAQRYMYGRWSDPMVRRKPMLWILDARRSVDRAVLEGSLPSYTQVTATLYANNRARPVVHGAELLPFLVAGGRLSWRWVLCEGPVYSSLPGAFSVVEPDGDARNVLTDLGEFDIRGMPSAIFHAGGEDDNVAPHSDALGRFTCATAERAVCDWIYFAMREIWRAWMEPRTSARPNRYGWPLYAAYETPGQRNGYPGKF